jgi:hypothetical protein
MPWTTPEAVQWKLVFKFGGTAGNTSCISCFLGFKVKFDLVEVIIFLLSI